MIATVTANPCIDKTVSLEKFDIYKMNRVRVLRTDPSGKGINVSYALRNLGEATLCMGFDFTDGASVVKSTLGQMGIEYDFVDIKGKLRTCTKIFDESLKHTIEMNEYGAEVTATDEEALLQKIVSRAKDCEILTLSGSLPKGMRDDFYYRCIREIRAVAPDCKIVVDAEKTLLMKSLEASPYFIKPNIYEFQTTFDCQIDGIDSLDKKAREVVKQYGLGLICVSLGKDGAYITDGRDAFASNAAKVEVRSIQGAGDSMVAGICIGIEKKLPLDEILRYGVAAAGASVRLEGTQFGSKAELAEILQQDFRLKKLG